MDTGIKSDNFFVIYHFMISELNLKGNELLIYAFLYGYCKNNKSYVGSKTYISKFTGVSLKSVYRSLDKLKDKQIIMENENEIYVIDIKNDNNNCQNDNNNDCQNDKKVCQNDNANRVKMTKNRVKMTKNRVKMTHNNIYNINNINNNIDSISDDGINDLDVISIKNAFGIKRDIISAEFSFIYDWLVVKKYNIDLIIEACNITIINLSKPNFKYANKILCNWNSKGIKKIDDIKLKDKNETKNKTKNKTNFDNYKQRSFEESALGKIIKAKNTARSI